MTTIKKRKIIDNDDDMDMCDVWWGCDSVETNNNLPRAPLDITNSVYSCGNEIHFNCSITKNTIQEIIRQITVIIHKHIKKSSGDSDPLNIVYIVDSGGGSVSAVLKFVDFVNIVKSKHTFVSFTSIITGSVASAGTTMSIIADKRYMTKNATAMIHELSSGNSGKFTELLSYTKHLQHLHDKMVDIYCEYTKKPRDQIEVLMRNETWFTAEQYLKHGFVHEIK